MRSYLHFAWRPVFAFGVVKSLEFLVDSPVVGN